MSIYADLHIISLFRKQLQELGTGACKREAFTFCFAALKCLNFLTI